MSATAGTGRAKPIVLTPLVLALLAIFILAFLVFRFFFIDFAVAASLALFLSPLQKRLTARFGNRPTLAAALLVLLVIGLILVPIVISATLLGRQAVVFFEWVRPQLTPDALQRLINDQVIVRYPVLASWLRLDENTLPQVISNALSQLTQGANSMIQTIVARLTSALFDLVLFVMLLFFTLRDGRRLRDELARISPLSSAHESEILAHIAKTVKGVLLAMIVVPIAQGLMAFLGFLAFDVPSPFLWSVFVVLAALIPLLGSPLGWVPAVIYLFLKGATWQWVGMLIFGVLGISAIDNLIKPLVLKDTAQIHPMLGFLSIVGGLLAFGATGFLIGPVVLSLVLSAVRIYHAEILRPHATGETAPPPGE
ncbi:MAG: AI-2E family transporter [Vicinamibacteria bacterium]|jgi:predicted PurR-regulated permease PerM|nr:AI-2E family transporter [Vicinamibacteria bacterium]